MTTTSEKNELRPFVWVAGLWLAASLVATALIPGANFFWTLFLWVICAADLFLLARAVRSLLELAGPEEPKAVLAFRASYWGLLKLSCLGLLIVVLINGRNIPALSLFLGTGTLVVVPLFGGYRWSQRFLKHGARV